MGLAVIITEEWYSLFAHVEGRDVLFDICRYMAEGCVRFRCFMCLLDLIGYFIRYSSPPKLIFDIDRKKDFMVCQNGYQLLPWQLHAFIVTK